MFINSFHEEVYRRIANIYPFLGMPCDHGIQKTIKYLMDEVLPIYPDEKQTPELLGELVERVFFTYSMGFMRQYVYDADDRTFLNEMFPLVPPETGEFIGYKKLRIESRIHNFGIARLRIPEDAKRTSAFGRKCRCDKAIVESVYVLDHKSKVRYGYRCGHAIRDYSFVYRAGALVKPEKPFEENRWFECSSGIHFFMTEQEAIDY